MFRFRISHLLLLFVTISVAGAWYVDHQRLVRQSYRANHPINYVQEKQGLWSPSNYLMNSDTATLEAKLSKRVDRFEGKLVTSSQGLGQDQLRQPTPNTFDAVIRLLYEDDDDTRVAAAQLIALYLQGLSGRNDIDTDSLTARAYFQANGLPKARQLLQDSNVEVRGAAALILGNTFHNVQTMGIMQNAFDKEPDSYVKIQLSWAYQQLTNNYDARE